MMDEYFYFQVWVRALTAPMPIWVSVAAFFVGVMLGRKTR